MSKKSLNRFLQSSLPENLIPNKRLGHAFRTEISSNNAKSVERECLGQWVFSWNTLERQKSHATHRCISHRSLRDTDPERKTFISPATHRLGDSINRALGGNILEHLDDYIRGDKPPVTGKKVFVRGEGVQGGEKQEWSIKGGQQFAPPCTISRTLYSFQEGTRSSMAEFVERQIKSQEFSMIYSLDARTGKRREKINDDYRNQLAECKKIGYLYGNLPQKTLVRAMRRAEMQGGDVGCNFLCFLETRLDVALKRAFFFSTLAAARQWISRGKITVNNQPKTVSSYQLQPGDFIACSPRAKCLFQKKSVQFVSAMRECPEYNAPTNGKELGGFPRRELHSLDVEKQKKKDHQERRFLFSPLLMQKWKRWSELWGNSRPSVNPQKHQWGSGAGRFFLCSTLGQYFSASADCELERKRVFLEKSVYLLSRPKTLITSWLKRKKPLHLKNSYTAGGKGNHSGSKKQAFLFPKDVYEYALLLHQQQPHVVDGLYSLRWNSEFATKKSISEKKSDWRWSCIKPLHLECSYKYCTFIFLYAPQKLAWPSSINLFLLKRLLSKKGK